MRVSSTALILLAPIVNWFWQHAVLMTVKIGSVNVVLDVPLLVLADQSLDEHFVALAQGLAADVVLVGTGQVLLARDQICVADNGIVLLGCVALVAIIETGTLVA